MMKIPLDKYYTPRELALELIELTFSIIGRENISDIIEPSAGNGAFSSQVECRAYDIEPEGEGIIRGNFLEQIIQYKKGRLIIGNPPFGTHNSLIYKFLNKSADIGDYIAFILPISMKNNIIHFYRWDLILSRDIGIHCYSGVNLHCCFNIYMRPKEGEHSSAPNYKELLKGIVEIREYRRQDPSKYKIGKLKEINDGYTFGMCNWGNGCLGKRPTHVGEFAQELYFYCSPEYEKQIDELCEFNTIREFVKSISAKKISAMAMYQYLYENLIHK